MTIKLRHVLFMGLIFSLALLPACSAAPTPSQPTTDPNAIYTQAVQTVQAGLTQTAAAQPTATQTPAPTETPEPTATPEPPTLTPTVSTTGVPTLPQPGAPTQPSTRPLATTAALGQSGDHASFGSQSPADGASYPGLSNQQVFWSLLNNGTTTWTTNYKLVWFGGRQLSGTVVIPVEKETKPGQKMDFYTLMVTPPDKGTYTSFWHMVNASGQVIPGSEVYLKFVVN
jgi:hypothetical protein